MWISKWGYDWFTTVNPLCVRECLWFNFPRESNNICNLVPELSNNITFLISAAAHCRPLAEWYDMLVLSGWESDCVLRMRLRKKMYIIFLFDTAVCGMRHQINHESLTYIYQAKFMHHMHGLNFSVSYSSKKKKGFITFICAFLLVAVAKFPHQLEIIYTCLADAWDN